MVIAMAEAEEKGLLDGVNGLDGLPCPVDGLDGLVDRLDGLDGLVDLGGLDGLQGLMNLAGGHHMVVVGALTIVTLHARVMADAKLDT